MTQQERLKLLNKGFAFKNKRGKRKPFIFKFCGTQWTTNYNRDHPYSMDDKRWSNPIKISRKEKLNLILNQKVKPVEELSKRCQWLLCILWKLKGVLK